MSAEEEAYVNLRLKLAEGLKERRQSRGITQVGVDSACWQFRAHKRHRLVDDAALER
jgi:hypothetical protein